MVILADRGFGRAEWAAVCQELGFHYLVRIKPDVTVVLPALSRACCAKYPTQQGDRPRARGTCDYRKDRRVKHNVVIRWQPGLPKKRDEPWFLMTDLDGRAERLCQLYGRRMSVEELFRDHKSRRNGQSLRDTQIRQADRFDRFLLILALAYMLLVGAGAAGEAGLRPVGVVHERRARECSVFTIGKAMIDRLNCPPDQLLQMIRWATIEVGSKWG